MVSGLEDLRVRALLKANTGAWNCTLIDQIFNPHEDALFKSMPQFHAIEEDRLCWWRSKTRCYSVRSGYYALMEDLIVSSHLRIDGVWMTILKCCIPPNVKLLACTRISSSSCQSPTKTCKL